MTLITIAARCTVCNELVGQFGFSGIEKLSKEDREYAEAKLPSMHKRCPGSTTIQETTTYDLSDRVKLPELVPKQERNPGGGRKPNLIPCPHCGSNLSARQRRAATCIHCLKGI